MREISLTNSDLVALVDDEDYGEVAKHRWRLDRHTSGRTYVCTTNKLSLHRFLLPDAPNHIDHINGNGLDNRRCNLREATARENAGNTGPYVTNTSGYKGVHIAKAKRHHRRPWRATIRCYKTKTHLGSFQHAYQAALAYNIRAKEVFGSFAYLNNIMAMPKP